MRSAFAQQFPRVLPRSHRCPFGNHLIIECGQFLSALSKQPPVSKVVHSPCEQLNRSSLRRGALRSMAVGGTSPRLSFPLFLCAGGHPDACSLSVIWVAFCADSRLAVLRLRIRFHFVGRCNNLTSECAQFFPCGQLFPSALRGWAFAM